MRARVRACAVDRLRRWWSDFGLAHQLSAHDKQHIFEQCGHSRASFSLFRHIMHWNICDMVYETSGTKRAFSHRRWLRCTCRTGSPRETPVKHTRVLFVELSENHKLMNRRHRTRAGILLLLLATRQM